MASSANNSYKRYGAGYETVCKRNNAQFIERLNSNNLSVPWRRPNIA